MLFRTLRDGRLYSALARLSGKEFKLPELTRSSSRVSTNGFEHFLETLPGWWAPDINHQFNVVRKTSRFALDYATR